MHENKIKKIIRSSYAKIAKKEIGSCCRPLSSCCGNKDLAEDLSQKIGYKKERLHDIPVEANLGLGCGNPVALAGIKEGETVLDLGSGTGLDCFLAAKKTAPSGHVIGVEMTPEMIEKARENASRGNFLNVEFRLGEIENLPVEDNSIDVVISNCVINLSPAKDRVFKEIYRVLKPGGRFVISDIVLVRELPDFIKNSIEAYVACISGAIMRDEYIKIIKNAGFQDVRIIDKAEFLINIPVNEPNKKPSEAGSKNLLQIFPENEAWTLSISVSGVKPEKCQK
ncbi:MAG: arsenite methyltransferase [Candidatus Sumerlaeia bacterium]|nr:arsenite methyltransferase [Candidatus Sumerlaeia bacterium]